MTQRRGSCENRRLVEGHLLPAQIHKPAYLVIRAVAKIKRILRHSSGPGASNELLSDIAQLRSTVASGLFLSDGHFRHWQHSLVTDDRNRLRTSSQSYVKLLGAVPLRIQDDDVVIFKTFN